MEFNETYWNDNYAVRNLIELNAELGHYVPLVWLEEHPRPAIEPSTGSIRYAANWLRNACVESALRGPGNCKTVLRDYGWRLRALARELTAEAEAEAIKLEADLGVKLGELDDDVAPILGSDWQELDWASRLLADGLEWLEEEKSAIGPR
jgi:hypothetical protein